MGQYGGPRNAQESAAHKTAERVSVVYKKTTSGGHTQGHHLLEPPTIVPLVQVCVSCCLSMTLSLLGTLQPSYMRVIITEQGSVVVAGATKPTNPGLGAGARYTLYRQRAFVRRLRPQWPHPHDAKQGLQRTFH